MELFFIGLSLFALYAVVRWMYRERPATKAELIEARFKNIEARLDRLREALKESEDKEKELARWKRAIDELKNN